MQLIDIIDYYLLNFTVWEVVNAASIIDNIDFATAIVVIIVASTIFLCITINIGDGSDSNGILL